MQIEILDFRQKIISGLLQGAEGRPVKLQLIANGLPIAANWGIPTADGKGQSFRFNLSAIWNYLDRRAVLQIRADDQSVTLASPGFENVPKFSFFDLKAKIAAGFVFNEKGGLQLSKTVDIEWQNKMFRLYDEMRLLLEIRGIKLVVMYGTLLGAHRGGNFIGHDHDFDAGYISSHTDPIKVGSELVEVAELLSRRGFRVSCKKTCIWVTDPQSKVTIDVFQTYFDSTGKLQFPFGVCGVRAFTRADFEGYKDIDIAGRKVLAISNTDALVEYIYGPHWQTPNPGHNWDLDRTEKDPHARPSVGEIAQIYWTDYYLHSRVFYPSSFAEYLSRSRYLRRSVIDLGCGNGRDTLHFAANQSCVIGVDSSAAAIEAATAFTKSRPGGASLAFIHGNLADWSTIKSSARKARSIAGKGGVTFYARFLLHALSEQEQRAVLSHISKNAEKGDTLALEFRTTQDAPLLKAHKSSERRFVDPKSVKDHLLTKLGFHVAEHQQGSGFSPYMNENPHLCRIIAVKL